MLRTPVKMFRVKELLLSAETFNDPIFEYHLKYFRWYGYVASEEQPRPWFSLFRCTLFTASIWISCALMLARVFRGYEHLNDGATSCATAVQYFAVSIATLNAYVQRDSESVDWKEYHGNWKPFSRSHCSFANCPFGYKEYHDRSRWPGDGYAFSNPGVHPYHHSDAVGALGGGRLDRLGRLHLQDYLPAPIRLQYSRRATRRGAAHPIVSALSLWRAMR